MTQRARMLLIVLTGFLSGGLVGGIAGGYVSIAFASRFFADSSTLENSVDVQNNVAVLQSLRDGQIEKAMEILEETVDHKIIALRISKENSERTNQAVGNAIQKTKDYRAKFPRHSKIIEIDKAVSEALGQK